ncbi:MAG: hypothetical protein MZV64_01695 [Ignavibacteriales bacterium]|nr:hypothetical protein [Ignavibacteriales bacterium]
MDIVHKNSRDTAIFLAKDFSDCLASAISATIQPLPEFLRSESNAPHSCRYKGKICPFLSLRRRWPGLLP